VAKQTAPAPQNKSSAGSRPARRTAPGAADNVSRRLGSNSIGDFYRESISELKKVTWPTWQDASNLTLAVVGMTLAISLFLGLADEIFNFLIKPLIGQ
jgi:preprotein translocase subunit SecE